MGEWVAGWVAPSRLVAVVEGIVVGVVVVVGAGFVLTLYLPAAELDLSTRCSVLQLRHS